MEKQDVFDLPTLDADPNFTGGLCYNCVFLNILPCGHAQCQNPLTLHQQADPKSFVLAAIFDIPAPEGVQGVMGHRGGVEKPEDGMIWPIHYEPKAVIGCNVMVLRQ